MSAIEYGGVDVKKEPLINSNEQPVKQSIATLNPNYNMILLDQANSIRSSTIQNQYSSQEQPQNLPGFRIKKQLSHLRKLEKCVYTNPHYDYKKSRHIYNLKYSYPGFVEVGD